jgi:hypothetical protein
VSAPHPPEGTETEPPRPPAWEAGAIGVAVVAVAAGLLWWTFSTPGAGGKATASYLGDAACRDCHPGPAAAHAQSGHSKTLRRVESSPLVKRLDGVSAPDPEVPGATWTYARSGRGLAVERRAGSAVERFVLEYAFGSGRHATTFVTLTRRDPRAPEMTEHRLTYFAHDDGLDVTPGQSLTGNAQGVTQTGRHHAGFNTLKCFECHTTVMSDAGGPVLDEASMRPNVTCERCHGAGLDHVEAARAGASANRLAMPLGPGRQSTTEELTFCGQCHRLPEMITGKGAITPENPALVRHQPVGLMQSACYTRSGGALSCSTCHDPHGRASTDTAAYEAKCLSCHGGSQKPPCPVSPREGCIGCHMPRRETTRGMTMSDHWIRTPAKPSTPGGPPTSSH